jgi:hypothetical protein
VLWTRAVIRSIAPDQQETVMNTLYEFLQSERGALARYRRRQRGIVRIHIDEVEPQSKKTPGVIVTSSRRRLPSRCNAQSAARLPDPLL